MATKNYNETNDERDWFENLYSFDDDLQPADESFGEDIEKIERIIRESTAFC